MNNERGLMMDCRAVVVAAGVLAAGMASATEFSTFSPRALSLGGAGTGGARGAYSTYYNPAGLAESSLIRERIAISLGVYIRDYDLVDYVDRLADYDWDDITHNPVGNAADASAVADILREIPDDTGIIVGFGGAVLAQAGRVGFGVLTRAQLALIPDIDKTRLNITSSGDPDSIANNLSAIDIRGLATTEVPLAYAHPFEFEAGRLSLGAAIKFINAETYNGSIVVTEAESDTLSDELDSMYEQSAGFGLDAGAQFHFAGAPLTIGVLARNLNSPKFDTATDEEYEDPLQVRAGVEWGLVPGVLSLAGDVDVTRNETLLPGYESQMIGMGATLEGFPSIFALALRAGLMKNIAESDAGLLYTAGIGLGFRWVHIELSAAVSTEETEVEDTTIPKEAHVALSLASSW
jgi:hypothetical protein